MSNYTNLKNAIRSVIKANGNNEITGPILQAELLSMITTLGAGYQYMGVAQPSTNPGTPDARVMYLAYLPGTYSNFGGIAVTGFCVLKYDTSWTKEDIPISGGGGADFLTEPDDLTLEAVGNTQVLKFANRVYNSEQPNGMGYKILRKDATFASQVTDTNTIYEIRYDFSLDNTTVTIPSGCVLRFVGGSIIGGTLNMNGCRIEGDPRFDTVVFSGSIANGFFNVTWIANGNDIGAKVNYAQQYFTSLYIPAGDYVFATPIVVNSPEIFQADGNLIYSGLTTNGGAAITIINASSAVLNFHFVGSQSLNMIDYNDNRTVNFIGILLKNCKTCRVNAIKIYGFNEGIRLMGTGGSGGYSSYNRMYINAIWDCSIGLRIYWANVDGSGSYSNESTLYGCRIGFSGSAVAGKSHYGIVSGPPNLDPDSYKEYPDEQTNVGNSNIGLYECCLEGLVAGVKVYSIAGLRIIGCREEGANKLLHVVSQCNDLTYIPAYQKNLKLDLSTAIVCSMANWGYEKEIKHYAGNVPTIPNGFVLKKYAEVGLKYADSAYRLQRGVIIDTSTQKAFRVYRFRPDGTRITDSSLAICYLKDDGTAEVDNPTAFATPFQSSYDSGAHCFYGVGNFVVPPGINKIFVGSDFTSVAQKIIIYSIEYVPIITDSIQLIGTTANRPANLPPGIGYYDTDISKLIYRVNNAWVDSLGAAI